MESQWISIKERLPEKGVDVRIKMRDDSEIDAFLCTCCGKEFRCSITGAAFVHEPTHWMPLPEPPQQ